MTTPFIKGDRRRKMIRRKRYLTIHFPERRSGWERRTGTGQKLSAQSKKENGKAKDKGLG